MKKLILLPFVAALLLSSCSSKFGVAKRKYTKGYYFSVTKNKPEVKRNPSAASLAVKSQSHSLTHEVRVNSSLIDVAPFQEVATLNHFTPAQVKPLSPKVNHGTVVASAAKSGVLNSITNNYKPLADLKNIKKQVGSKNGGGSGDTNTILLVILCLFWFLNLVAVYLHQGKKITTDFWITLLLDLTVILGIVYSILVVLDLLSFA